MKYFWTYQPEIPEGIGFGLYSPIHLLVSAFLLMGMVWLIKSYQNATQINRRYWKIAVASSIVLLEIFKDAVLLWQGTADWQLLPLHLCGMGILIVFFDALYQVLTGKQNKMTKEVLYSLTLPGAIAALLFPDWVYYPIANVWAWQSFLIHTLLVTYVAMQVKSGEFIPDYRQLWRSALFLLIALPPVAFVNHLLGTNFYFLNTAVAGSPLEILQVIFGPFYVFSMLGLLLIVWVLIYWPWIAYQNKITKNMIAL